MLLSSKALFILNKTNTVYFVSLFYSKNRIECIENRSYYFI